MSRKKKRISPQVKKSLALKFKQFKTTIKSLVEKSKIEWIGEPFEEGSQYFFIIDSSLFSVVSDLYNRSLQFESQKMTEIIRKSPKQEEKPKKMQLPQTVLRKGDENEDVKVVQSALIKMGFDLGNAGADGDFGGKSETAVEHFQQYRMVRSSDGKRAGDDGVYGPTTARYMTEAMEEGYQAGQPWMHKDVSVYGWRHPKYGRMESTEGKTSTFGGPNDKGDRRLSQGRAYVKDVPEGVYTKFDDLVEQGLFRLKDDYLVPEGTKEKDAGTNKFWQLFEFYIGDRVLLREDLKKVGSVIEKWKEVVFKAREDYCLKVKWDDTGEEEDFKPVPYTSLPQVYGINYSGSWDVGEAGVSFLLEGHRSYYCALRTKKPQPNIRHARVVFFMNGKACCTVVSDYGPAGRTDRNSDLSPGTLYGVLGGKTDDWIDNQCWAADDHFLGLVE